MKDAEIIINDVVKGEYDLPRQFSPVIHEIPDATSKNAGKSLTVDKDGRPTWGEGGGSIQHDWYQNDPTAADYIKNRPGGYTKTTPGYEITWDGVVGDKIVVDGGEMQFVKVSDRIFTAEELIGATMVVGDTSLIVSNDTIISQNGIITNEGFLVCSAPTTIEGITFTETGTYFMKMKKGFVSSLSKPDSTTTIKIPAELTTVVGGYDREARTDELFNGVVKPSDFVAPDGGATEPRSAASTTQYCALITLATSLIDGYTVTGTVNGVEVHGEISGNLCLYDVDDNIVLVIGAIGNMTACALPDYSIPSSDLVIILTQSAPAGPVVIPEKYLDLERVNGHISYAQMTAETAYEKAETAYKKAETAQSTANAAQTAANTVKTTAETAQSTANTAKTTAETAQSTANTAKTTAETAQSTANTAKTTANNAATKKDPVITGSFSQNRKSGSVIGDNSHAEGTNTTASGIASHAEGVYTIASGSRSHAEGWVATASGLASHAEGEGTIARGYAQHVQGRNNIPSGIEDGYSPDDYAHIVGNGSSDDARSNAHTLTWSGIPWYKKRPQFGGNAMNDGAQTVVANGDKEIVLTSTTSGSTKKFRITVDDTGTIKATEVTE